MIPWIKKDKKTFAEVKDLLRQQERFNIIMNNPNRFIHSTESTLSWEQWWMARYIRPNLHPEGVRRGKVCLPTLASRKRWQ